MKYRYIFIGLLSIIVVISYKLDAFRGRSQSKVGKFAAEQVKGQLFDSNKFRKTFASSKNTRRLVHTLKKSTPGFSSKIASFLKLKKPAFLDHLKTQVKSKTVDRWKDKRWYQTADQALEKISKFSHKIPGYAYVQRKYGTRTANAVLFILKSALKYGMMYTIYQKKQREKEQSHALWLAEISSISPDRPVPEMFKQKLQERVNTHIKELIATEHGIVVLIQANETFPNRIDFERVVSSIAEAPNSFLSLKNKHLLINHIFTNPAISDELKNHFRNMLMEQIFKRPSKYIPVLAQIIELDDTLSSHTPYQNLAFQELLEKIVNEKPSFLTQKDKNFEKIKQLQEALQPKEQHEEEQKEEDVGYSIADPFSAQHGAL